MWGVKSGAACRSCAGRRQAHGAARVCALALSLPLLLLGHPRIAGASTDGGPEYQEWRTRLNVAAEHRDAAEELLCVTTIGRRWNWALNTLPHWLIERAASDARRARLGERIALYQMLYDARWKSSDGAEPSGYWRELSLSLYEHGREPEAFAVAAHITDPYELVGLQADNRYRRIAKADYVERDIVKAANKELERRRARAANSPRDLARLVDMTESLSELGRYTEVVQITNPVLQYASAAPGTAVPYEDFATQLPWVLDARADALRRQGKYEDSLELLQRAAEVSPADGRISHGLNLTAFLLWLNRPDEALAALPKLEGASPYGQALAGLLRVEAASESRDAIALESALKELQGRSADYPALWQHALVIAGRDDEAATALVARLADLDLRTAALVEMQDFAEPPGPELALAWRRRQLALRARPEVHRALEQYGRVRSYPLEAPDI